jgi:hypothetical protein
MKIINNNVKLLHHLYFILIGLSSYVILSFMADIFSFSENTKQLLVFGGVLTITNFTIIFTVIRKYLKQHI